jgi:hypothetical protein
MMVRGTYIYILEGTYQANAFIIEVLFGVILPFVLILFKKVRNSAGWLFFASTVFVLGILLNRINVFLVSYTPPYKVAAYFPALGEIFITIGLIATLMFLYRVFVFIFPVLGVHHSKYPLALILMMIFSVLIFSPGKAFAAEALDKVGENPLVGIKGGRLSLDNPPKVRPLNSPDINKYSDLYAPVPFKHDKHFKVVKDCTACHHRQPREKGDKYGEPVKMADLRRLQKLPVSCSTCHERPFNPRQLHVPGLKGAYHQLCMDCHRKSEQARQAGKLILSRDSVRDPKTLALKTRPLFDCLTCHAKKGTDLRNLARRN